jgi:hypothetical protein
MPYSVVTLPFFTLQDWARGIPRGLAALAILIGAIR